MRQGPHICLLVEVLAVTVCVVALLVVSRRLGWTGPWFAGPSVLMMAALLPTFLGGRELAGLGLRAGPLGRNIRLLCVSGAVLFSLALAGVLLFKRLGGEPPLGASRPTEQWALWAVFQFAYAALPEELFFRGYLLSNTSRLLKTASGMGAVAADTVSVIFSAVVFALSHVLILANPGAALTFFPGLIFAWLFVKTKSLIGPVLLHGAANIGYALMLMTAA